MLSSAVTKIRPVATTQTFASNLFTPVNITGDSNGNLFVIDFFDDIIKVTAQGVKSVFAGNSAGGNLVDGTGAAAVFNDPTALACDASGNVYIADNGNARIRKATTAAVVTTISNFYQVGVREMGVSPDGSTLYMRSSNSGDTTSTPNVYYFANDSNYGSITMSGLTYPEDTRAGSVTYNQNGSAYFSPTNPQGSGPKLYRIGTPSVTSNVTTFTSNYTPVTADVNNYPGSNQYTTYTQFSNVLLSAGSILTFLSFGGQWTGINGRTFTVGFSNVYSDTYPLAGTFIDIVGQLYNVGTAGMAVNVSNTSSGSNVNTTLISNAWTINSYFGSGGNMYLYFSNDLSAVAGSIKMTGLTGNYSAYNGVLYTLNDCNTGSSPYQYRITITPPSGSVGKTCTFVSFTTSATATGVTGVTANMSNLFSPSANVITGMEVGILKKYTLSGDVATLNYSCNVGVLYGAIGGVANVTSTLIPEVYSLIPGTGSDGTISIIRNVY